MGRELQLCKDQHLTIEGVEYLVTGGMEFHNRLDGSIWTEYCLQGIQNRQTRWLSVDNNYEEYAIYQECSYNSDFEEISIQKNEYREADSGKAEVTGCFGITNTEPGDMVSYTEYEDGSEELIMAVEQWEDGTEYSRGYYLDRGEIVPGTGGAAGETGIRSSMQGGAPSRFINIRNLLIGGVILAIIGVFLFYMIKPNKKPMLEYLKTNTQFSYQTSITSDLNSKEKADVYSTALSVDDAVKVIIQAIDGETEDVQKSEEDNSVAILTKDEYCLVYTSTDQITMVQISSRAYVYQSTNTPYHATHRTHSYYRGFYYTRGLWSDRNRYSKFASGYEGYSGDTVEANRNDPYKSYSDSVRQSSINSRNSSGGGISSGK